jgi:hypothetical protein
MLHGGHATRQILDFEKKTDEISKMSNVPKCQNYGLCSEDGGEFNFIPPRFEDDVLPMRTNQSVEKRRFCFFLCSHLYPFNIRSFTS